MRAEISYDLVIGEEMDFVEGSFRLPGRDWQVFIIMRYDVTEPEVTSSRWESGVSGLFIRFPRVARLNRIVVERVLSAALGVGEWVAVHGPDSMKLR